MTVSTHTYSAHLIGTPDVELSVCSGSVTLDSGQTPHVSASLEVVNPGESVMTLLDPRENARVRIEVDTVLPAGTQSRTFDLGLRDRTVDQVGGTVSLDLASDEGLLADFAPLADDGEPFVLAESLRDVVNYVLGEAIPGAELEASPTIDADMTPYWQVTNLMPNPSVRGILGNWVPGGANATITRITGLTGSPVADVTTATLTQWSGNSGINQGGAYANTTVVTPYLPVRPFTEYTISVWAYSSVSKSVVLQTQIYGADGMVLELGNGAVAATVTLPANTWTRVVGTITTGANAARLGPMLFAGPGVQWTSGEGLYLLGWMVHEDSYPVPVPYFDGATPADADYTYLASGEPHASATTRTPLGDAADPDSLIWKAGQNGLEFLHPLVQKVGMRLVCDELRRWTLRDERYVAPDNIVVREGINLIDGRDAISRDAGNWFDAAVTRYSWNDTNGITQERVDAYALTTPYTRLQVFDKTTPYPGPGFSEYSVRRAQGRGRELSVRAVSDWRAVPEQLCTFEMEGSPAQVGAVSRVDFDLSTDEMTLASRTIEVPDGAIDLLTGTIDALAGTIDGL